MCPNYGLLIKQTNVINLQEKPKLIQKEKPEQYNGNFYLIKKDGISWFEILLQEFLVSI